MDIESKASLKVANLWAFLGMLITAPFIVVTYKLYPPIMGITIGIFVVMALHYLIVAFGADSKYSRIIMGTVNPWLIFSYHMLLRHAGDGIVPGLSLAQGSMTIMPWVLYSTNERKLQLTMIANSFLTLCLPLFLDGWGSDEFSNKEFYSQDMTVALFAVAGMILFICYILSTSSYSSLQKQNAKLWKDMETKQQDIQSQSADLKSYVAKVEKQQAENEKRQWVMQGLSELNNILRGESDWDIVKDRFLSHLISYLKVNQGAVYVVSDEEGEDVYIELSTCYAYSRKKHIEHKLDPGEGLLGQAYLENDTVYRTEIPEDYIRVTSGLGEALPTSLLIVPLRHNEEVLALVELASFREFAEHEINLVKESGEGLASFLSTSKVTRKMRNLVSNAEKSSEQMREQEHMMRQNMEEIMNAQEEYSRTIQEKDEELKTLRARILELETS
ncbi:hypothetical protein FUAX_48730 (plasmid) [Fulvitalea axinellae]|uniref:GAF domain-containing protein n=2 Tax=Fulvitalea axinellae TaxID=1182444 RepID=A0AAU9CK02_9BACT|nr:hypothetical protein FUAX_48730 [Fulvitalea axinellae]